MIFRERKGAGRMIFSSAAAAYPAVMIHWHERFRRGVRFP